MSDEIPAGTRLTKNGALQDIASGRFLPGGKPTTTIRTSEQGKMVRQQREVLRQQRKEAVAEGAVRGILEGVRSELPAGVEPTLEHAGAVLAQAWYQAALANAMDKPRDSAAIGAAAFKLPGLWPERGAAAAGPMVNVQVNVSPELLRAWEKRIVDAEVRDADEDE